MTTETLIGVFAQYDVAVEASKALKTAGFKDVEISEYHDRENEPVTDGQLTDTREYDDAVPYRPEKSSVMLTVQMPSDTNKWIASEVFRQYGASDVNVFIKPPTEPQ